MHANRLTFITPLIMLLQLCACGWISTPRGQDAQVDVSGFQTSRVTYLTLSPEVGLQLRLSAPGASHGEKVLVHASISNPVRGRMLAETTRTLRLQADHAFNCTFTLQLEQMQGLLARVEVLHPTSRALLATAERPFDVTNDLRTNFRYAGETYGGVSRKLEPRLVGPGKTGDDFWAHIPIGVSPQDELRALYGCFLNAAEVNIDEDRGHYTCWAEDNRTTWTKSAYYARDFWVFDLHRIRYLFDEGNRRGITMLPWTDGKGLGDWLCDEKFPWVYAPAPRSYYPGSFQMNLDPAFKHPLTEEDRKLIYIDTHGAESWLDYIVEELDQLHQFYGFRAMWWDNSHGTTHIPYTLNKLRGRWQTERPGAAPPMLMINGDAGYNSDLYWIERDLPDTMTHYLGMVHTLVAERPAVRDGAATISIGQDHPRVGSGAQEAITDAANPYNRADCAFMYRQLLFEGIAAEAKVVHQQQWPRNALEWRILHFPDAFREHARTWGFQTLFAQVYNARDVMPYPGALSLRCTNLPFSTEFTVEDGKVHLVARAPLSSPETIYLHLFNYTGSTTQIHGTRPRPTPQPDVQLELDTPGYAGQYRVRAFSPEFANLGDGRTLQARGEGNRLRFSAPLDIYTLVIIDKPW